MKVYRITGRKYAGDISGTGGTRFGGRWNKKGRPVLYTGESIEIALLEALVHVPYMMIPSWDLLTIQIPENSVTKLTISDLPENWDHYPAPELLTEIAEKWIVENQTIALKVLSCIITSASNYILNCHHPDYRKVIVADRRPFDTDKRLLKLATV